MAVAVRLVELMALVAVVALLATAVVAAIMVEKLLIATMLLMKPASWVATTFVRLLQFIVLNVITLLVATSNRVAHSFWPSSPTPTPPAQEEEHRCCY